MKPIEKRVRALEVAAGSPADMSFVAQVKRAQARGGSIPRIIVQPGETVEEVLEREGIADDMPFVVRRLVGPQMRLIERIENDDV